MSDKGYVESIDDGHGGAVYIEVSDGSASLGRVAREQFTFRLDTALEIIGLIARGASSVLGTSKFFDAVLGVQVDMQKRIDGLVELNTRICHDMEKLRHERDELKADRERDAEELRRLKDELSSVKRSAEVAEQDRRREHARVAEYCRIVDRQAKEINELEAVVELLRPCPPAAPKEPAVVEDIRVLAKNGQSARLSPEDLTQLLALIDKKENHDYNHR